MKVIFKQQIIRFFSLNHWGDFLEGSCVKAKQGVNGILELCFFTTCDKVWKKKESWLKVECFLVSIAGLGSEAPL